MKLQNLKNKKFKLIIIITLGLLLIGLFNQRHALACELIAYSNFNAIAVNLYVDPKINTERQAVLINILENAQLRVKNTFGQTQARPKILVVSDAKTAAKYGANTTATTHITPFGQCIVLGPKGQNIDVVAHEIVHAEIASRLGFWTRLMELPVWFDEGIALLVDYRQPFLPENISLANTEIENVKQKFYGYEFFSSDSLHTNYQAARLAVANIDPKKLYPGLIAIGNGKSFAEVFGKY